MKKTILALVCLLTTVTTASAQACYEVVPLPQSIQMQKGEPFVLDGSVQILVQDGLQNEADFLQAYLQDLTGLTLGISGKREKKVRYIELAVSPKVAEREGYELTVSKKGVTIEGGSAAGVF